jgi:hypothetical protein
MIKYQGLHDGIFIFVLVIGLALVVGCSTQQSRQSPIQTPVIAQKDITQTNQTLVEGEAANTSSQLDGLEDEWGIKLIGIRQSAAGYMLDFRYQVLDPTKAAPILQRKFSPTPYLLVEKSGAKLAVPWSEKVGSMRQSVRTANQIKANKRYFMLFANPGRHVKVGDKVTLVIGDFVAQHVSVQ